MRPETEIRASVVLVNPGASEVEKPLIARSKLKLGDRVRVVRLPPMWATPGYRVPASTRRIYKLMISRRRAMRIYDVDYTGAWVRLRVRGRGGRLKHHHITLDDGCWVWVRRRGIPS